MSKKYNYQLLGLFLLSFGIVFQSQAQVDSTDTLPVSDTLVQDTLVSVPEPQETPSVDSALTNAPEELGDDGQVEEEESNAPVALTFIKKKILQGPDSLYFNVCKIKNNQTQTLYADLKVITPVGWPLISDENKKIRLEPGQTHYLPIRLSMARDVVGGRTYLVNVFLTDDMGNKYGENAFITVPRKSKWNVSTSENMVYFNKNFNFTEYSIFLENKGNSEETFKIEFEVGRKLRMIGDGKYSDFAYMEMPPNSDTTLNYVVKRAEVKSGDEEFMDWKDSRIQIDVTHQDRKERLNVWFKSLESEYENDISNIPTPLNVQMMAVNVVSPNNSRLETRMDGTLLLNHKRRMDYYYRHQNLTYTRDTSKPGMLSYGDYFWKQSRFEYRMRDPKWSVRAGDQSVGMDQVDFGRGVSGSYRIDSDNEVSGGVVYNLFQPSIGGALNYFGRNGGISYQGGISYKDDDFGQIDEGAVSGGIQTGFLGNHFVRALLSVSQRKHNYDDNTFLDPTGSFFLTTDQPDTSMIGYGYQLLYRSKIGDKWRFQLTNKFGSKYHTGQYGGRFELNTQVIYKLDDLNSGVLRFLRYDINPMYYFQGQRFNLDERTTDYAALEWRRRLKMGLTLSTGPIFEHGYTDQYNNLLSSYSEFEALSYRWGLRMNYKPSRFSYITPLFNVGISQVQKYDALLFPSNAILQERLNPNVTWRLGLNLKNRYWGMNMDYYYGPNSVFAQSSLFYGGTFNKVLQIRPYYDRVFKEKNFRLSSFSSYSYSAENQTENINLNANVDFFLNHGWTAKIQTNLGVYSRNETNEDKYSQKIFYLNLGVRKSFDIPHPRVKYHDLEVVFFQDLNGNQVMDENEKYLDNIMLQMERSKLENGEEAPGKFAHIDMVSDGTGKIHYKNIPEGAYKFHITPLFNLLNLYNVNGDEQNILIAGNSTVYIPFSESHKIVGKVILERDENSSKGLIQVRNVRVTASDSLGNEYFSLTDSEGNFIIYVPQSESDYKVSVNNVFGPDFKVKQEEFTIHFNGLKVFDVSFVFEEKKRTINFNNN